MLIKIIGGCRHDGKIVADSSLHTRHLPDWVPTFTLNLLYQVSFIKLAVFIVSVSDQISSQLKKRMMWSTRSNLIFAKKFTDITNALNTVK